MGVYLHVKIFPEWIHRILNSDCGRVIYIFCYTLFQFLNFLTLCRLHCLIIIPTTAWLPVALEIKSNLSAVTCKCSCCLYKCNVTLKHSPFCELSSN